MKILLLGGTGAIGSHLVNVLAKESCDIYVTSRQRKDDFNKVHYIQGNAKEDEFLESLLKCDWDVIVDFMKYKTDMFKKRMNILLNSTKHYVFLSSSRVYADNYYIKEDSDRLLDVLEDLEYLNTDEYALTKARQEDLLRQSLNKNWTIIRPYITYSEERLQLGVLEKEYWLYRALQNKTIIFPEDMLNKLTTLTFAEDVAQGIKEIIGNSNVFGETYHITGNTSCTWREIFDIYNETFKEIFGREIKLKLVSTSIFLQCYSNKYQVVYDRMYDRRFDNEKINGLIDNTKFVNPKDGLSKCLREFCREPKFLCADWRTHVLMDKVANEYTDICDILSEQSKELYLNYKKGIGNVNSWYCDEKNVQILIALLKKYGIRKVIASPGTTNISFVGSIQSDPYFEVYSCVDERSAAYMACGMAAESKEVVCLSCTGATASRNYFPALTEAYYRKLPILAITSTQFISKVGNNIPQVIDRTQQPVDTVKSSVTLPVVKDDVDFNECVDKVNRSIIEMFSNGGGPVHINLQTGYSRNFNVLELPEVRMVKKVKVWEQFPILKNKKIAVFVGSHKKMEEELVNAIDDFCSTNNAVVFCDHTSGYNGKYKVMYSLVCGQQNNEMNKPDILIWIGDISGDYYSMRLGRNIEVWRVSEDGKPINTLGGLTYIFDMPEIKFFTQYIKKVEVQDSYYNECKRQTDELRNRINDIPFSNIWIASIMSHKLPQSSVIHFGILNSLRAWNLFDVSTTVETMANVGGFGIDGCMSTLIGSSLINRNKLHFLIIGDLAFFYDMNVLGNRHIGNNVRILLINNGKGTEFKNPGHCAEGFADDADKYIAGAGHFGEQSNILVKNYVQNLGYAYMSASNKQEFLDILPIFMDDKISDNSIVFEVFTNDIDEKNALKIIRNLN